jgi:hypothetical protein
MSPKIGETPAASRFPATQADAALPGRFRNLAGSSNAERQPETPEITEIAKLVLTISGIVILGVSAIALVGAAIAGATQRVQTSQTALNALLRLLGTWVGAVLAYYFSRKNFESASQSVERMVNLTVEQ